MKYEDIQRVNKEIKTIGIERYDKEKNQKVVKQYPEVAQRVTAFRKIEPNGEIRTQMLSYVDGVCVFRATVIDGEGHLLASGHAYEKESNGNINKTSCIENCETSAVGRALAFCGIGSDESIASAEEVLRAGVPQQEVMNLSSDLIDEAEQLGINLKKVATYFKKTVPQLTNNDLMKAIEQKRAAKMAAGGGV